MPKVKDNMQIGPMIWKMRIEVPKLVKKAQAGQFVIIRVNEEGERVPMSIAGLDKENGLLTVIYQVVGKTSATMTTVPAGGDILDCVGPLGVASHVDNWGTACVVGGGIGIADRAAVGIGAAGCGGVDGGLSQCGGAGVGPDFAGLEN